MIVVDTSVILAYMNVADSHHARVADWLEAEPADLVTTPLVVSEVDHLVAVRGGPKALSALREDLAQGAYVVDWWPEATGASVRIAQQYADARVSLADASLAALAERHATERIATLDERHFRAIRPLTKGPAFELLPSDA